MTILELYPNKFIIDPITNCWLWQGYKAKTGHGQVNYKYKVVYIHRLSAWLAGIILDINDSTIHALHKQECPNKHCGNPEHLYAGTPLENAQDRTALNHPQLNIHCKYGHEFTPENTYIYKNRRECKICRRDKIRLYRECNVRTDVSPSYKMNKHKSQPE